MMILYVSSWPKSLCIMAFGRICISASQFISPSKSVSSGNFFLLLNDLL